MLHRTVPALAFVVTLVWSALALASAGTLKVLTYNVAGLPDGFSTAHPSQNMPQIGALLARYDLALLQEDYAYGAELRRTVTLPHQSPAFERGQQWNFGDGLSQFSSLPFATLQREPWRACHGMVDSYFDCLTPKGFTFTLQQLAEGVEAHVYNVHFDAGSSAPDSQARSTQMEQLIAAILSRSAGRAVLLAGDTNIRGDEALLARLESATGLVNACKALRCPEPRRIDRVYYRSSQQLVWSARKWSIDRRFVDAKRQPLSDHLAVAVELGWRTPE